MTKTHSSSSETSSQKRKKAAASTDPASENADTNSAAGFEYLVFLPSSVDSWKTLRLRGSAIEQNPKGGSARWMEPVRSSSSSKEMGYEWLNHLLPLERPGSKSSYARMGCVVQLVDLSQKDEGQTVWGIPLQEVMNDSADRVADHIRNFQVDQHSSWKEVTKEYPEAKLFAVECSPTSVAIDASGIFTTRARLIIHIPHRFDDGFETFGSMTVPSFITGNLHEDGTITINEFRLSVNHPG